MFFCPLSISIFEPELRVSLNYLILVVPEETGPMVISSVTFAGRHACYLVRSLSNTDTFGAIYCAL